MGNKITNESLNELRTRVVPPGCASVIPWYAESAKGAVIRDVEGREYVDFAGGIGTMNVGHSHPKVVEAIKDQAEKLIHTCFLLQGYPPIIELAEKLCTATPGNFAKKTMFLNSGAEAVENAVKIVRYSTKKSGIIVFQHAFHGRTLLTMTMTSKIVPYKFGFGPYAPEIYRMPAAYCYRCPFGLEYPACEVACADYLKEFFITHVPAESAAAVVIEPVMGEGGFITPPPEYFSKLKKICEENGVLFVADEIQCGMGRTGKMFAMEHWKVAPDLITAGKSLAAGMPLSAVVGKSEIMDTVYPFGLGGTYSGNPVACRAALAVMEIYEEENMLQKAKELGEKLRDRFENWKEQFEIIGDVRGLGAMLALELVKDRESKTPATEEAKALVKFCHERGLIVLVCGSFGNVIRVLAPFVITDEQIEKGFTIMEEGLASI